MREIITPWFDGSWDDVIDQNPKFNTVYAASTVPGDEPFEVISRIDDVATPFDGTTNEKCYFFTYKTFNDDEGQAVTCDQWVDYLYDITSNAHYGRPITTLTIFAHGQPGFVKMSDNFNIASTSTLLSSQTALEDLRNALSRLKYDAQADHNVLARNATILLFSCHVGQGEEGKAFVKNLANWTGATVYANTELTGSPYRRHFLNGSSIVMRDWDLDVIGVPDNYDFSEEFTAPVKSTIQTTLLLPAGVLIRIPEHAISSDGAVKIKSALEEVEERGITLDDARLVSAFEITLTGTSVAESGFLEVTIPFDPVAVNWKVDSTNSTVQYWDEELQQWSDKGIWDVNFSDDSVTFKTNHTTFQDDSSLFPNTEVAGSVPFPGPGPSGDNILLATLSFTTLNQGTSYAGIFSDTNDPNEGLTTWLYYYDTVTGTPGQIDLTSALDVTVASAAPVPEPATLLLVTTGLGGLFGFRKKFRKK